MAEITPVVPKALKRGDCIAFISPSARLNNIFPAELARVAKYIEAQRYVVKTFFEEIKPSASYFESTTARAKEIHDAFRDPEVKAILCTIGGNHANDLPRRLDYELIAANPKIFCGYSDITNLHHAILYNTGLRTFYAPCALSELADDPKPDSFTTDNLWSIIAPEQHSKVPSPLPRSLEYAHALLPIFYGEKSRPRDVKPSPPWTWLRRGHARGRLLGGCVSSLMHTIGTEWSPDYTGRILFIESAIASGDRLNGPPIATIKEQLVDMINCNIFDKISGLVVGRPYGKNYNEDKAQWKAYHDMILDVASEWDWPILAGIDIGHTSPILTLPIDAMAELDSQTDRFAIMEACVS